VKRIGITGSRSRNSEMDYQALKKKFFEIYQKGDIIVSGDASAGADHFADLISMRMGITRTPPIEPDYNKHGRRAPLERNCIIARECDILIAMPNPDSRTQGTRDTITKFLEVHNNDESLVYFV
jgi:hypothetical protein